MNVESRKEVGNVTLDSIFTDMQKFAAILITNAFCQTFKNFFFAF